MKIFDFWFLIDLHILECPEHVWAMVAHFATEHSATDQRAWIRGLLREKSSCMLMAPGTSKTHRKCDILQVPIQIIPLAVPKQGSYPLCGRSKL